MLTEPLDACEPVKKPILENKYIGLSTRGNCSFDKKVINSQRYFVALIIFDNVDEELVPMSGNSEDVLIPSVLITKQSGNKIRGEWHAVGNLALIKADTSSYLLLYLIPFILFLLLILIALLVFLVYRIVQNYRASRKLALSRSQLRKLKKISFLKGESNYETCAICIEDFVNGEKLRILPCNHAYHCKCIDKWLLKRRRVCPICKHVIRFPGETIDSDIEQDSSRPTDIAAASASVHLNDEPSIPQVAVQQPRRKRRTQHTASHSQPTASMDERLMSDEDSTDCESESALTRRSGPSAVIDRVANRLRSAFQGEPSESAHDNTVRSKPRKRTVEDRMPLVDPDHSGRSSPTESANSNNVTVNENLGFEPEAECAKADDETPKTH
ncbi:E3 ubiquitin-protein ligase rnf13 [Cichlidogyrus casuarinus]|uniref:E3 ubiquitin-protein ligase rnf13 n=1 Tax=Cichlidogyrus casuarinus TaxID=1844966 RepID=A0ABD2PRD7_9PLAT